MLTQAYGPHPLLRAASPYVPVGPYYGGGLPPTQPLPVPQLSGGYPGGPNAPVPQGPPSGGYTLPPTAAYFPVTAYTNNTTTQNACVDNTQQVMMSQDSLNLQQPNTPDLLMHRRAVSLHIFPKKNRKVMKIFALFFLLPKVRKLFFAVWSWYRKVKFDGATILWRNGRLLP